MTSGCEFVIDGVTLGVANVYHVVGRCGDVSFRVGDVFDHVDHPLDAPRPVSLRVTRIVAYQHSLDELGHGMTASIDVQGDGVQWLRPRAVLVSSQTLSTVADQESAASQIANNV